MPTGNRRQRGRAATPALAAALVTSALGASALALGALGARLPTSPQLLSTLGCAVAAKPDKKAVDPEQETAAEGLIVFPPDKAVLLSGGIDIIVKSPGGKPVVDGKPCSCEPFKNPLYVKRTRLSPGMHTLRIGDRKAEFVVALNEMEHEGPDDWRIYKSHLIEPGRDRCGACHETEKHGDLLRLGGISPHTACLECHSEVDFAVIHSHPLEPLEPCQLCHVMHGSTHDSLLKAPPKQLCNQCHES